MQNANHLQMKMEETHKKSVSFLSLISFIDFMSRSLPSFISFCTPREVFHVEQKHHRRWRKKINNKFSCTTNQTKETWEDESFARNTSWLTHQSRFRERNNKFLSLFFFSKEEERERERHNQSSSAVIFIPRVVSFLAKNMPLFHPASPLFFDRKIEMTNSLPVRNEVCCVKTTGKREGFHFHSESMTLFQRKMNITSG